MESSPFVLFCFFFQVSLLYHIGFLKIDLKMVNANDSKFTQITLSLPKRSCKQRNLNVHSYYCHRNFAPEHFVNTYVILYFFIRFIKNDLPYHDFNSITTSIFTFDVILSCNWRHTGIIFRILMPFYDEAWFLPAYMMSNKAFMTSLILTDGVISIKMLSLLYMGIKTEAPRTVTAFRASVFADIRL